MNVSMNLINRDGNIVYRFGDNVNYLCGCDMCDYKSRDGFEKCPECGSLQKLMQDVEGI